MITAALQFKNAEKLGIVAGVDTNRVAIGVTNQTLLTRVGIGNLLAIQGATANEYLIAMAERVTRSVEDTLLPVSDDGDEFSMAVRRETGKE